ncbi:hypothetical protein [Cohnella sp. JJ-181]|uniref:hypothetical protein n=1 Tax=Cohnella rhizoplanae TaxID=2974897 RepID=UPI0022FFADEF|nr:hypothetical protein [Cohnella sp. JJ-181]CAI6087214.1 hypothetical protein COHCIP112018_05394 [Cohnella sp. JJ-181]
MNRSEVIRIMEVIKRTYPSFDVSAASIDHYAKRLLDFPFDAALENVERHVLTERFPPVLADIRGRLGDQLDSQRSKTEAAAYEAQLEAWRSGSLASPPPPGYWDEVKAKIRGRSG